MIPPRPRLPIPRFLAGLLLLSVPASGEDPADPRLLDYALVITGGELLEGIYPDAHTPFITRSLLPLGCRCVSAVTVDDVAADICDALRFASAKAPLTIVTGGLGPTPNDITRETLSGFTGIALKEHPEVLARMTRRYGGAAEDLRPNLRRQALVPVSGGYLNSVGGSAAGLIFDSGDSAIVALPGPPKELQPMVRDELFPWLKKRFGVRIPGSTRTLRFVGAGQSSITQTIEDRIALPPDLVVTSLFEASRVDFTFSLPDRSPAAEQELDRLETQLREHLGEYFYADDGSSLEEVIQKALQDRGDSLVLAEIGSGGHLAAAFATTGEVSESLAGAYVAGGETAMACLLRMNRDQPDRAESSGLQAIADTAAALTGAQWAIVTGPVRTDAHGKRHVETAFKTPGSPLHLSRIPAGEEGSPLPYDSLVTRILDQFRRLLP